MIQISNKTQCCGCGGCRNACPKKCIIMQPDNEGFLYPKVDASLCVECGICEKVCPILQVSPEQNFVQRAYVVQHKDASIRRESTSGGAFTAIASYVLEQDGIVFGAAFDESFQVCHVAIENTEDLSRLRNSKYVQSDTRTTFTMAESYLKEGKLVLYSGTPCQIEGLLCYLRKPYDNLITVDVVCHAVPSPKIWELYRTMQEKNLGKARSIYFREKHYGYQYTTMTYSGDKEYAVGVDSDPMLRAFFSNICDRPSCYHCSFKKQYRLSDFTLWDCFPIGRFSKEMDDNTGATRVLVHSEKGNHIFSEITDDIRYLEIAPEVAVEGCEEMFHSISENPRRSAFFDDAQEMDGETLFGRYFPKTARVRLEHFVRMTCYRLGIYSLMKKMFVCVTKKY